jgi:threonine/homoserine efflux transporter RhtA
MTLYFLSVARIPLATAVSTFFVGPIIAVVLSLALLKERMTFRKAAVISWSAPAWNDLVFFAGLGMFSAISHMLSIAASVSPMHRHSRRSSI